jgi:hypothetical protein
LADVTNDVLEVPKKIAADYGDPELPLGQYAAFIGLFNALFAGFLLARKNYRRPLPDRIDPVDIVLLGVAAHKLSRVITKSKITAAVRAPFTRFEESAGAGEVEEEARGQGTRKAIGQLLTCPHCISTWISSALIYGFVFNPRVTRLIASIFTVNTIVDFLHLGFVKAKEPTP